MNWTVSLVGVERGKVRPAIKDELARHLAEAPFEEWDKDAKRQQKLLVDFAVEQAKAIRGERLNVVLSAQHAHYEGLPDSIHVAIQTTQNIGTV